MPRYPINSSAGTPHCFKPISGRLTYREGHLQNIVTHLNKWGAHSQTWLLIWQVKDFIRQTREVVLRDRKANDIVERWFYIDSYQYGKQGTSFSDTVTHLTSKGLYPTDKGDGSQRSLLFRSTRESIWNPEHQYHRQEKQLQANITSRKRLLDLENPIMQTVILHTSMGIGFGERNLCPWKFWSIDGLEK